MTRNTIRGVTLKDTLFLNREINGDCWLWTGPCTPKGYGSLWVGGERSRVHRASYALFVGPIPEGLEIDHLCHVRNCFNPVHLEPVTHHENVLRSAHLRRLVPGGRCLAGHLLAAGDIYQRPADGRQHCRPCKRAANRRYKDSVRARKDKAS